MPQRIVMPKRKLLATAVLSTVTASAYAEIEEMMVTATKQSASTQDIPVAVSAVSEEKLEQLGVSNFADYLVQLPGVTAGGSGPGQNTIYIRGVASTTPNLTTAGVAGLAPNVALYLDEQPLAQPGRNLDVYTADMNRVEVLSGPQGTLFGASSQAGTVRLITNKPDYSESYGKVKAGVATTQGGEESINLELMGNFAINDRLAVRGVFYTDTQGGYIDNVPGQLSAEQSARFRSEGTVRANGVPVNAQRAGFQADADLSAVNFIAADNSDLVEDDFNEATYNGGRISLAADLNENWNVLLAHSQQKLDTDGVFFADPEFGDDEMEVSQYQPNRLEDEFSNTAWTLEGRVAALEIVYTGAFTSRDTDQLVDYSDYLFVGQYLPYYICDGSVSYPGDAAPSGTCQAPNLFVDSTTDTEIMTHEFRISTDQTASVRLTAGAFYSDLELEERNDFNYPGSTQIQGFGQVGFSDNFPFDTGFTSQDGPFPAGTIFRNDIKRTDEQYGAFGELTFDIGDQFAVVLGARYYDIEVDLEGSANSSFCNLFQPDADAFGTDISDIYNADGEVTFRNSCDTATHITYSQADVDNPDVDVPAAVVAALQAPDTAATDGSIVKLTGNWTPTDDALLYFTWSEGFRPGILNRPGGRTSADGNFTVPYAVNTDEVTNYEFGWKTDLADRQVRFNGSLFFVEVQNLQTTILDPSITNLFFSDNAADAEVLGLELDFIYAPADIDGLTISGALSLLDTEITNVITPTNDVREGDSLAFAPEMQFNLQARYEWEMSGLTAHVMPHIAYADESYSDIITINRIQLDSWLMAGITLGVSADSWSSEFYVDNLTDERAEVSATFLNDRERITYARPLTAGLRFSYSF